MGRTHRFSGERQSVRALWTWWSHRTWKTWLTTLTHLTLRHETMKGEQWMHQCAFSVTNFSELHRLLQVTTHSVAPLSSISSWSLRAWAALEQQGARN